MFVARQGKEIVIEVRNRIGLLLDIAKMLAEKGESILAISAVVSGEDCVVRFVTDDNLRAMDLLRQHGYAPREVGAILLELPHKPGMFKRIAESLSFADIDIHHAYATALDSHESTLIVLHTSHDDLAIPRLNGIT